MTQAPVFPDTPHSRSLWQMLNVIPDDVLLDYLADQVVDDTEIEDITRRLEQLCTQYHVQLEISPQDHALLRQMVHHSVDYIRHQQASAAAIEGSMCQVSLQQVKDVMGSLLDGGKISLGGHNVSSDAPDGGDLIPDERPADYDEEAPNLLKDA